MSSTQAGFHKIMVAFDGSSDSEKAVRAACSLSSKFGSVVEVIHVYHVPTAILASGPRVTVPDMSVLESSARESGQATLARGLDIASKAGVNAKGVLIENASAVEGIVNLADQEKADLIVLGTRGMTGFKKLIIGSISSGVVSHAGCPVLVVR